MTQIKLPILVKIVFIHFANVKLAETFKMADKNITEFLVKFMEDLEINTKKWEDQIKNCLSDDMKSKSIRKKVGFHFLQFLISAAFDKSIEESIESIDGYDFCTKIHDDDDDDYNDESDFNVDINKDNLVNKTDLKTEMVMPNENGFWNNVNNPILLTNYLESGRVDTNLTITTSQRNEDQLIYSNYIFAKKSYTPSILDDGRGIFKWRCVNHAAGKKPAGPCKGQVATTIDGLCVLLDSVTEHNHLPDNNKVQGILYRQRLKTIAINHPNMKTSEILASAEMLADNTNHRNVIKDEKSLHRFIQRVRAKNSKGTSMEME